MGPYRLEIDAWQPPHSEMPLARSGLHTAISINKAINPHIRLRKANKHTTHPRAMPFQLSWLNHDLRTRSARLHSAAKKREKERRHHIIESFLSAMNNR
jgi:hypothetical protein